MMMALASPRASPEYKRSRQPNDQHCCTAPPMDGPEQPVAWPGVALPWSRAPLSRCPARVIYMCAYLVETASPVGTCLPVVRFSLMDRGHVWATATGLSGLHPGRVSCLREENGDRCDHGPASGPHGQQAASAGLLARGGLTVRRSRSPSAPCSSSIRPRLFSHERLGKRPRHRKQPPPPADAVCRWTPRHCTARAA